MYSLWFEPSGRLRQRLQQQIRKLAEAHETPVFPPHVTLLGDIEEGRRTVRAKARTLAAALQPLTLRLAKAGFRNEYFRCVFYEVENTASLKAANKKARKLFCREADAAFFPHLSLVYGNIPQEARKRLAERIGSSSETFTAASVSVVNVPRTIDAWEVVERIKVSPPASLR